MTIDTVLDLSRQTLWVIVSSSAPMLIISLVVGLVISIFQTVTSIQEQTLTFVPKLLAIFLVIALAGQWIMGQIVGFMIELCSNFTTFIS